MLSAWAVDRSISLGQLATDEKSNEITAIPQRLDNIEIKGAAVSFFIASIPLGLKKFARDVRGHWAVESTLHGCLDVTFREDKNRV